MRQLIAATCFSCLGLIACSSDGSASAGAAGTPGASAGHDANGASSGSDARAAGAGSGGVDAGAAGAHAGAGGAHAGSGGSVAHAGSGGSVAHAGSGGGQGVAGSAAGSGGGDQPGELPTLPPPVTPGDPGSADVMLSVRTDRPLHAISPLIYGTNGTPDGDRTKPTVARSGGNRLTAYNWENNASNAGSDYMFQNDDFLSKSDEPAKPILDGIQAADALGAASIVTIPIVDYVSADKNGGGDVRNSGSDYLMTRFKQNEPSKGSAFAATPDTSDAFVYEDEYAAFLKSKVPASRVMFSLDNEPDLWSSTHAEVHPMAVTYAELWDRNQKYASALKQVWPEAPVLGFVSYGYAGYTSLQSASDAMGRDFIEWYLDQAKAAEASAGKRLIDYLDLHWYPEAQGGGQRIINQTNDAAVVTAREQAPRSLWDMDYKEDSWIVKDGLQGEAIHLVPRILAKIDAHYPGTKLSFTEWNYGGGDHISGAIAVADVLGIFGREGVSLATYWALHDDESFAYAGMRAYRNYDGNGAAFGDVGLDASTSDVENVTVYASLASKSTDDVVVIAINKATADKTVALTLAHPTTFASLHVYRIAGTSAELAKQSDQMSAATNAWKLTLPAQSVNVLVPAK
jgi:hypothetical protein